METIAQNDTSPAPGMEIGNDMAAFFAPLLDPVSFGERMLQNRDGSPRRYREYQKLDLRCQAARIVHLDGRSVGKTVNLATLLLHFTFVNKGKSVLVAAPYQGQLNMIAEEFEFQLGRNERLKNNVARKPGGGLKMKHHPYFEVVFKNGCAIYFRPAGDHGDVFRSLHVDLLMIDEAAWLSKRAWSAIRQCLNADGLFRVYSTPNGLRGNPYHKITQDRDWRVFRWPSWIAPDWSEKREQDLLKFYGGKNNPGWQHEVAGEHGAAAYGAFDAKRVVKAMTDLPDYRRVDISEEELAGLNNEREVRERLESLLLLSGGQGTYWLGGDLGYTNDPTELLLFEEDQNEVLSLVLRVHAEHVPYPVVSDMIALIDRVYNPQGIGLDRGGNGGSVEQELLRLDKYANNFFAGRLVGYDFGGSVSLGADEYGQAIKKPVKEQMTTAINKVLNEGKLRLPKDDPEFEDQLCGQTYMVSNGRIIYSKGSDHLVDSMRTALLRRAQEIDPQYDPVEIRVNVHPVALTRPLP